MADNRGVVYLGPEKVAVQEIDFPKLEHEHRKLPHAVILKIVSSNICGSDQHMVRGRTTAPRGMVLGHEITGEVIEKGDDVEFINVGDLVSVPFNVACGRCRNCKERKTDVCLNVNHTRAGGAYGYVDLGGWTGGQANYVMVPYADFNLLKFPDKDQAMAKILDLTCLTDILPTGYHGAVTAGVGTGSTVYIHAKRFGFETIDLSVDAPMPDQLDQILGVPEVDAAIDCVGFEAHGSGGDAQPAVVLNTAMEITRAGGAIGIPGLYVTEDPGASTEAAKHGSLNLRFGVGWAKSLSFFTGQTPVMKYNRELMMAILYDRIHIADIVGVQVINLDQAPQGYAEFDRGAPHKYVIDPNGSFSHN
jgi:glutathione-independent formaldehyde dehydrogenase